MEIIEVDKSKFRLCVFRSADSLPVTFCGRVRIVAGFRGNLLQDGGGEIYGKFQQIE